MKTGEIIHLFTGECLWIELFLFDQISDQFNRDFLLILIKVKIIKFDLNDVTYDRLGMSKKDT